MLVCNLSNLTVADRVASTSGTLRDIAYGLFELGSQPIYSLGLLTDKLNDCSTGEVTPAIMVCGFKKSNIVHIPVASTATVVPSASLKVGANPVLTVQEYLKRPPSDVESPETVKLVIVQPTNVIVLFTALLPSVVDGCITLTVNV